MRSGDESGSPHPEMLTICVFESRIEGTQSPGAWLAGVGLHESAETLRVLHITQCMSRPVQSITRRSSK